MKNPPIIWRPSGDYLTSRIADFAEKEGIDTEDWRSLIKKSTDDIEWFWNSFLSFAGMQWSKPYRTLLDQSRGLAWSDWFIGGETNIAYNCLDWHVGSENSGATTEGLARQRVGAGHLALIWENESGQSKQMSYDELNISAGKVAALLKQLGVDKGDAVGIYMPMVPEALAILFGCFKLGAVAVPVFSGFGSEALAKRMQDAQSKVIFTTDGGKRRGKLLEIKKDVDQMRNSVPSLTHVVVVKYCENRVDWFDQNKPCDIWFENAVNNLTPLSTAYDLPSEHPSLYLYTSGTTGKAKGTIHTHAGALTRLPKNWVLYLMCKKQTDSFGLLILVG